MGAVGGKSFSEWKKDWKSKYNITVLSPDDDGNMDKLTSSQRAQLEKHLDAMYKEFPILKQMPLTMDLVKNTLNEDGENVGALYDSGSIDITADLFNQEKYDENLKDTWYAGVLTSFHPKGTNSYSTLDHELGHAIVDYIVRQQYNQNSTISDFGKWYNDASKQFTDSVVQDASKGLNNSKALSISHYATYDSGETISEAISDYMANGSRANPYSIAIVKELKKRM